MLDWEETEVTEMLGVEPEYKEENGGPFHLYNVRRNGLGIELAIFPFETDVELRLYHTDPDEYFYKHNILNCKNIRRLKKADGNIILELIDKNGTVSAKVQVTPNIVIETINE